MMMHDDNIIGSSATGLSGPDVTSCHSESPFFTPKWAQFLAQSPRFSEMH
jgi:hypothetical protein